MIGFKLESKQLSLVPPLFVSTVQVSGRGAMSHSVVLSSRRSSKQSRNIPGRMQLAFHHGSPRGPAPGLVAQRIRTAHIHGMGQTANSPSMAGSVASLVTAGAGVTTGILGTLSALAAGTSVAGPIGLAITGLVGIGVILMKIFSGCGQTCMEASNYANQVESTALKPNLEAYLAAPVHYASLQAAALNNFQTAWNALEQACGSGALASTKAGQSCISDRDQGSCAYKTSPGGWQQDASGNWSYVYPGANGSGTACWNWWVGYHDTIANDPTVVPDPTSTDNLASEWLGLSLGNRFIPLAPTDHRRPRRMGRGGNVNENVHGIRDWLRITPAHWVEAGATTHRPWDWAIRAVVRSTPGPAGSWWSWHGSG